jgi:molecular chaperone DnaK
VSRDDVVLGIDLGTTNSVVAVADGSEARVLPTELGARLIPSVVSFKADGRIVVGEEARERRLVDAANTVYSVKRLIGRPFKSPEVRRAEQRFAFQLVESPNGGVVVDIRGETYTLTEISAFVLREVKRVAELNLGHPVSRAVITVPANFNELQRSATKAAGRVAGLEVARIVNEPTAAALAYGLGKERAERVAVFDLGGGTFDMTILELEDDVFEVRATAGDSFLGGDDIDLVVAERMCDTFLERFHWDPRQDDQAFERLRAAAEWAKCQLTDESAVQLTVEELTYSPDGRALDLEFQLDRRTFEDSIRPLLARAFDVCQEALRSANLKPKDVESVVLVGGSTRTPLVRQMVEQYFGKPPHTGLDPDLVVAQGAAIHGYSLRGQGVPKTSLGKVGIKKIAHGELEKLRAEREARQAALPKQPAFVPKVPPPPPAHLLAGKKPPPPPRAGAVGAAVGSATAAAVGAAIGSTARANDSLEVSRPPGGDSLEAPRPQKKATLIGAGPALPSPIGALDDPLGAKAKPTPRSGSFDLDDPLAAPKDAASRDVSVRPSPLELDDPLASSTPSGGIRRPAKPSVVPTGLQLDDPLGGRPRDSLDDPLEVRDSLLDDLDDLDGPDGLDSGEVTRIAVTPEELRKKSVPPAAKPVVVTAPSVVVGGAPKPPPKAPATPPQTALPSVMIDESLFDDGPPSDEIEASFDATFSDEMPALEVGPADPFDFDAPIASPARAPAGRASPASPPRAPASPAAATPTGAFDFGGTTSGFELGTDLPALDDDGRRSLDFSTGSAGSAADFASLAEASPEPAAASLKMPDRAAPLLMDVTPHSLGIETVGGYCQHLIRRNSPIPSEQGRVFGTASDGQQVVTIRVCQGESRVFKENETLGEIQLSGLRAAARGAVKIDVTFLLDASGTLDVRAVDADTGAQQTIRINLLGGSDDAEIARMMQRQRALLDPS